MGKILQNKKVDVYIQNTVEMIPEVYGYDKTPKQLETIVNRFKDNGQLVKVEIKKNMYCETQVYLTLEIGE